MLNDHSNYSLVNHLDVKYLTSRSLITQNYNFKLHFVAANSFCNDVNNVKVIELVAG